MALLKVGCLFRIPISYEPWMTYGLGLGQGFYRCQNHITDRSLVSKLKKQQIQVGSQNIYDFCFRGYRIVMHTGVLFGHYTRFHLFPDIHLGIYTSINGVEGQYSAMDHTAMFVGERIQHIVWVTRKWVRIQLGCFCLQVKMKTVAMTKLKLHAHKQAKNAMVSLLLLHLPGVFCSCS